MNVILCRRVTRRDFVSFADITGLLHGASDRLLSAPSQWCVAAFARGVCCIGRDVDNEDPKFLPTLSWLSLLWVRGVPFFRGNDST